ncbi:MAG: 30S ribosomal protein S9 [Nitrososphaeria archaeon]
MVSQRSAMVFEGSRKTARAVAVIRPGQGIVRINGFLLESLPNYLQRELISIPLRLAGDLRYKVDIDVKVRGGGVMGQAYASAIAISRALVGFTRSIELKRRLMSYDRHLLVGDSRRTEPKKFGGPGPRRRYQKSFR